MNDNRINVVWVITPGLTQKTVFVRSDSNLVNEEYPNTTVVKCDEIAYARGYEKNPTFVIVAIMGGKRHAFTYHNITFAEVVYEGST